MHHKNIQLIINAIVAARQEIEAPNLEALVRYDTDRHDGVISIQERGLYGELGSISFQLISDAMMQIRFCFGKDEVVHSRTKHGRVKHLIETREDFNRFIEILSKTCAEM